jgi:hypothetical protein
MSEYRFYAFHALTRRLSSEEQEELRKISSRAEITATSFTNEYSYGDLRGDPEKMLASYFDAYVYRELGHKVSMVQAAAGRLLDVCAATLSDRRHGRIWLLGGGQRAQSVYAAEVLL